MGGASNCWPSCQLVDLPRRLGLLLQLGLLRMEILDLSLDLHGGLGLFLLQVIREVCDGDRVLPDPDSGRQLKGVEV